MKAKYKSIYLLACLLTVLIFSCGKNKQSQSNLLESLGEGERIAKTIYGENSVVLAKGDLNGNGLTDIFTGVVTKKETDKKFWIKKGGILENNEGWKTILNLDAKLTSVKGNMVNMIEAVNGYLISFEPEEKPMNIFISIADSTGNPVSDEALIRWNSSEKTYEFIPNPGVIDNNAP